MGAAIVGMSTGPAQYAFGSLSLFIIPLGDEFGWNRTGISLASSFFTIALLFSLPVVGRLVDRRGSRQILIPSMFAVSLLLASVPLGVSSVWHLWLIFALIGCLGAGANALPYMRTIAAWFDRSRGLAIGITLAGAGLGYTYVPPLLQYIIATHGWRAGYYVLAGIILFVALPIVFLLFRESPQEDTLRHVAKSDSPGKNMQAMTRNDALRTRTFWTLFIVFSLLSFSLYGLMIHSVPMLVDRGMTAASAALGAATIGVTIMLARVVTGHLCDRLFAPRVAVAAFALSAIGLMMLANGASHTFAYFALILIGFSIGAEIDFMTFLTSRYFGLAHFGEIYGVLFASLLLGTSIGPVCFGWSFDLHHSYTFILWAAACASAIAAAMSGTLPQFPQPATPERKTGE